MPPEDAEQISERYRKVLERMEIVKLANQGNNYWSQKSDQTFCRLQAESLEIYLKLNPDTR